MVEIEYLLAGLAVLLLYIIYFIISRDAQQTKKISSIAAAVEDLNHQLYRTEKKIKQELDMLAVMDSPVSKEELHSELERGLQRVAKPVAQTLQEIDQGFIKFKTDFNKRLHKVEDGMRNLSMPSSVGSMDDEKIIALFKKGTDLDTIAKKLHLSKPEVEFVLKINKIR